MRVGIGSQRRVLCAPARTPAACVMSSSSGFRCAAAPPEAEGGDAVLGEGSLVDVTLRLPVSTVRALLQSELSALAEERAAHGARARPLARTLQAAAGPRADATPRVLRPPRARLTLFASSAQPLTWRPTTP